MFEGAIFYIAGSFFESLIKVAGVLSFILGLLLVYLSNCRIKPCIPLKRITYEIFRVLGRTETVFLMVASAVYLIASWAVSRNLFNLTQVGLSILSLVVGVGFYFAIGRKGIGLPLGYGVVVTIDKAPELGFPLSERVLSFHVNRKFLKYREEALARIAETILLFNENYRSHDAVFISWIFSNKARIREKHADSYKKVRFYLLAANAFALAVAVGLILIFVDWVYNLATKNFDGSHAAVLVLMGIILVCIAVNIIYVIVARNQARIIISADNAIEISDRVGTVADGLKLPEGMFSRVNIDHQPMSLVHLASFSITRKVMKSAIGIESGFVLIQH
jgi:hypothetical protein